jgi:GalNAc-alpha-(1->4)-GalNAc-alpha-(1->3)-diNAcBac-PP-undecaprenol alpha-1,4-N-acetyl-D-galactosaminyltransferase
LSLTDTRFVRRAHQARSGGHPFSGGGRFRLMLVIYSLARGGAERVMSTLANAWAGEEYEVTVVTLEKQNSDAYKLVPQVQRVALGMAASSRNAWQILWNNLRRLRGLRTTAKRLRPDVVISFTSNVGTLTLLALLGLRIPVIVSERADPTQLNIGILRSKLRRLLYPHAGAVVVQTQKVLGDTQRMLPHPRLRVIPNPVSLIDPDAEYPAKPLRALLQLSDEVKIVAGMGRLGYEKGFDLLIEAFHNLAGAHPDWHLVIFGKGLERQNLETQIAAAGLGGRVHLPGEVAAARKYLQEADIFILSSRFEGFPNVLVEAMACDRAVVSFNCPSGPAEIIHSGHDGLLVPAGDVEGLADAVRTLMDNPARRAELGRNAKHAVGCFSIERVLEQWNQLIGEVVAG